MKWLLALYLLAGICVAQDKHEQHKFWDRQNKINFAISAGVRVADISMTCYKLHTNPNWHEEWLPVKSCSSIAVYIAGEQVMQTSAQYYLHKTNHHKLERIVPYVWVAPNAAGISYNLKTW